MRVRNESGHPAAGRLALFGFVFLSAVEPDIGVSFFGARGCGGFGVLGLWIFGRLGGLRGFVIVTT